MFWLFCFDAPDLTWVKALGASPHVIGICRRTAPANEAFSLTHGQVLIIEDDPAVRNSLRFALEVEGFSVRAYQTGAELLQDTGETADETRSCRNHSRRVRRGPVRSAPRDGWGRGKGSSVRAADMFVTPSKEAAPVAERV